MPRFFSTTRSCVLDSPVETTMILKSFNRLLLGAALAATGLIASTAAVA